MAKEQAFIEGLEVAPKFDKRMQKRNELVALFEPDTFYQTTGGDYSNERLVPVANEFNRFSRWWNTQRRESPGALMGLELLYAKRVAALIGKSQGEPLIALDLGGGVGRSWIRLAKAFETDVAQGRVAFVVSNLQQICSGADAPSSEIEEFIRENSHLVNYASGDCLELMGGAVDLADDRSVPFAGHVGLVHERLSATYRSLIPEVDIECIAGMLSDQGAYFSRNHTQAVAQAFGFISEREKGLAMGRKAIVGKYGLVPVPKVEDGYMAGLPIADYTIFRKPASLPVAVGAFAATP
ncbi:hypothetical protein HY024_01685 [Candidatus Curtissbacteria bacterium]|nr:hypothetical protein [Candidatus Curtissbacteria bacterium]